MSTKTLILVAAVLCFSQSIFGEKGVHINTDKNGLREYVTINGSSYFIELTDVHREHAFAICELMNMTLISFETQEKWDVISEWLTFNGFEYDWFWTDGVREVNSTIWRWESSGAEITDFFWAPGEPSLTDNSDRSCINLSLGYGGWDDDYCVLYRLYTLCQ